MTTTHYTFRELEAFLTDLGFTRIPSQQYKIFFHPESNALLALPAYQSDQDIRPVHLVAVARTILDNDITSEMPASIVERLPNSLRNSIRVAEPKRVEEQESATTTEQNRVEEQESAEHLTSADKENAVEPSVTRPSRPSIWRRSGHQVSTKSFQPAFDLITIQEQSHVAVRRLQAQYGWELLDEATFERRTMEYVEADKASDPRQAAIHIYSQALYRACSGAEGTERQNQGYTELFRYLYDIARRRYPDHAAEITQFAIEQVFLSFERVRAPWIFLSFAFQQLRDAARSIQRQEQRLSQSLESITPEQELRDRLLADQWQPELSEGVIANELRQRFMEIINGFLLTYPRARRPIAALQLKYIDGLDDEAIGKALGVSVRSVYGLRSWAIKLLESDPSWQALAVELGILPSHEQ